MTTESTPTISSELASIADPKARAARALELGPDGVLVLDALSKGEDATPSPTNAAEKFRQAITRHDAAVARVRR